MLKKFTIVLLFIITFAVIPFSFSQGALQKEGTLQGPTLNGQTLDVNPTNSSSSCQVPKTLQELFAYGICLLNSGIIPFLIGLGLVIFLIGVVSYVKAGDNEEKRTAGRDLMIFGIIALFVMVGVWGLVKILYSTFIGSTFSLNANAPSGL